MAKPQKIRIILDTNWYISASINKKSRRTFYQLLTDDRLQILYTNQLLDEFLEVISRSKFKKIISPNQILRFVRLILPILEYINLKTIVILSRDPKDNYLLSLSKDGKAKYLITGDPDLLVIKQFEETEIVTMGEFQQIHAAK